MTDISIADQERAAAMPARRGMGRVAATIIAAGTLVNAGLWLIGRATGVPFSVTLAFGGIVHEVSLVEVVLATALAVAAGVAVVSAVGRRSSRGMAALIVVGAVFGFVSAAGAIGFANDTGTGLMLAVMHVAATTTFVLAARGVSNRWETR